MIAEYESAIAEVSERLDSAPGLTDQMSDAAIAIADLPDMVRGFEDLKMRRAAAYRNQLAEQVAEFLGTIPAA
jgi:indolepyruvate ferredoxin oxidoreductase